VTNHYQGRPRGPVSHFTFHHMAGNLSLEACQRVLQGAGSSASYGIDASGGIACYVDEDNAPWSDGGDSNYTTVSVEMADDGGAPDWHVSDATLDAAIRLCADVLARHGLPANAATIRYHQQYSATACPGPYIIGQFKSIIDRVAKAMDPAPTGKKLTIWQWHGGTNQQWVIEQQPDTTVAFRNVASGLYLDVAGANDKDGAEVICYPWHGGDNQRWNGTVETVGLASLAAITSALPGARRLDVAGASKADGGRVIVYHPTGGLNQDFALVPVQGTDAYYIMAAHAPGMCLDCNL
jgi:hypothetical protein